VLIDLNSDGTPELCEERKHLQSALLAARGEWIHFRLTASNRAAGITEAQTKRMVSKAKEKMDEIQNCLLLHLKQCALCKDLGYLSERPMQQSA
jgi:hypothetical protein